MLVNLSAGALGAAIVAVQLTLLREFLSLGGGNEATLGLALAAWLACAGAGSWAGRRARPSWLGIAAAFGGLALAHGAALWLIWGGRGILGLAPGEFAGWWQGTLFAAAAAGPAAFAGGLTFALIVAAASSARRVYVAEGIGACAAGVVLSWALYRWVYPLAVTAAAAALASLLAAAVSFRERGAARFLSLSLSIVLALAAVLAFVNLNAWTTRWFFGRAFPGARIQDYRISPYGVTVVAETEGQYAVYQNGLLVASWPDRDADEEVAHIPLLLYPEGRRVLLVGGGLSGVWNEFSKYRTGYEVTYVELDAALVDAARSAFDPCLATGKGIRFVPADGRAWVKKAGREGYRADVVIVAMPPPTSVQVNRYYTYEFYRDVRAALAADGVAAFSVPASANYYGPASRALLSSCYRAAAAAFPFVRVIPGERFTFVASDRSVDVSADAFVRALSASGVETRAVTPSYFRYRLEPSRVRDGLAACSLAVPANADLRPAALAYGLSLAASRAGGSGLGLLTAARGLELWYILPIVAVLATPWVIWRRRAGMGGAATLAVFLQGFTGIGTAYLLIVGYQIAYGAGYRELALITGVYMAGLAAGGAVGNLGPADGRPRLIAFLVGSALIALAAPAVTVAAASWIWAYGPGKVAFAVAAAAGGFCGGGLYVAATRLKPRSASSLYALDLIGAAVSAAALAAVFVPAWGLPRTAGALAALMAAAVIAVAVAGKPKATWPGR